MWRVMWLNYYWKSEVLILTTRQIVNCLSCDPDYYQSIEPL